MSIQNERFWRVGRHGRASLYGVLFAAAVALLCNDATAHSTVKGTTPASGSILPASPEKISIEFNEAARLIAVVVTSGAAERKLTFEPAASATSFTIPAPRLAQGRNEVRWTALSKDGHPIKGTIIIIVKPGATPQPATQKPQQDPGR